eukprot:6189714-Pleurochrysis_carterae.AAC.2
MPTAIASDVQPVVQSFVADILKGVVGKSSDATSASSKSTDVKPDTPSVTDAADRSAALPSEAREESNGSPAETAASLKERGNEMMAKSASAKSVSERQPDVEEAEMLYSRALELLGKSPDSERAVLFANRAEARLRCGLGAGVWQGKAYLEGCIADASEALRLQKSYPKVHAARILCDSTTAVFFQQTHEFAAAQQPSEAIEAFSTKDCVNLAPFFFTMVRSKICACLRRYG